MKTLFATSLLALSLVGCETKSTASSSASPGGSSEGSPRSRASVAVSGSAAAAAKGRPQKELTVTLDGKPVEIVSAFAFQDEGAIKIELSSAPLTCADFAKNGRAYAPGEVAFSASFRSSLQKDGSLGARLEYTWFGGMSVNSATPAKVSGDGSDGKPTSAELDFETSSAGEKKEKLVVKGKVDAIGCPPVKPYAPQPEPPPATDLMLEVAGKKVAVRTAVVEEDKDGDRHVTLYTGGEGCDGRGRTGDLTLLVYFKKDEPWQLTLMGNLIAQQMLDQTFDKKKVKVKLPASGGGEIELALDAEVMGYPVKVSGKIPGKVCEKKP